MAKKSRSVREDFARELVKLGYEQPYITARLREVYGKGIRKTDLLKLIAEEKQTSQKADREKYTPKKHKKEEYVNFNVSEIIPQEEYSDELKLLFKRNMRLTKEELYKRLNKKLAQQEKDKEDKSNKKGRYKGKSDTVITVVQKVKGKDEVERLEKLQSLEEKHSFSMSFKKSQHKEQLAFILALSEVQTIDLLQFNDIIRR